MSIENGQKLTHGTAKKQNVHLIALAEHILKSFESISNGARQALDAQSGRPIGDANVFATVNTMTAYRAVQNLASLYMNQRSHVS
jgi:hypothetical protein